MSAIISLLGWQKGQARLRRDYPRKRDFRPLSLDAHFPWCIVAIYLITTEPALKSLFELSGNHIRFRDDVPEEDRLRIESYIDEKYIFLSSLITI